MQGVYCSPRSWLFAMDVLPRPDRFAAAKRERESRLLNPPPGSTDPERFATVKMLASCKTLANSPARTRKGAQRWLWLRKVT